MKEIFRKEIGSFFNSLTGYIVIIVYLSVNSLFMWLLPGEWNVLDSAYASLDTMFILSPWIFLFLVPAVTMRTIADEKRSGTLETLITRPLSLRKIIYGKLLASIALVFLSMLPCLVYYLSVYLLGETPGNIDAGGTWGAIIGLFFLASIYAACGIFTSSLTSNQVVAFILAALVSLFMYTGFEILSRLPVLSNVDTFISGLGIDAHYRSMSRGVIDIRDIMYFIVSLGILSEGAVLVLNRLKNA